MPGWLWLEAALLICSDGHSGEGGRVSIRPRRTRTFSALGATLESSAFLLRVSPSRHSKGEVGNPEGDRAARGYQLGHS